MVNPQTIQIGRLARYYYDVIAAFTHKGGKHLHDISNLRTGAILTDLSLYFPDLQKLINDEEFIVPLLQVSLESVSAIVRQATEDEESAEGNEEKTFSEQGIEPTNEVIEKRRVAENLLAMYRKQESDPYNRETLVGFQIVAGTYGTIRYCAPLFYFPVRIEWEPLKDIIRLVKQTQAPLFNTHILADLIDEEGITEVIRNQVLPRLFEEEFNNKTVSDILHILSMAVPALKGLVKVPDDMVSLHEVLTATKSAVPQSFTAVIVVNAPKSHTFLLDDLADLFKRDIESGTAADSLIAEKVENIEEFDDPDTIEKNYPLLFPLESNPAQRRAARKAESGRLTVIEGPPGTGKSLTIANLVCHLVASGQTVLVTSHQNKALEIVTEKLPQLESESELDYLAMSMLKGEAASARQLANKLKNFDATIQTGSRKRLQEALATSLTEIEDCENKIQRLCARFSELKHLERQAALAKTYYHRYHEIRKYDGIHFADKIPLESQQVISQALEDWANLMKQLRFDYDNLCNLLKVQLGIDESIVAKRAAMSSELIELCEASAKLKGHPLLSNILNLINSDSPSALSQTLEQFVDWLRTIRNRLLNMLVLLIESKNNRWGIRETFKLLDKLGKPPIELVNKAFLAEDKAHFLVSSPDFFSEIVPSKNKLNEIEYAISQLERGAKSWLQWHMPWGCSRFRTKLERAGFGKLSFGSCSDKIEHIKAWVSQWSARFWLSDFLVHVSEIGVPVEQIEPNSTPIEFLKRVSKARLCLELLQLISERPPLQISPLGSSAIIDTLKMISDARSLEDVITILSEAQQHVNRISRVDQIFKDNLMKPIVNSDYQGVDKKIRELDFGDDLLESAKLKQGALEKAQFLVQLLSLERGPLCTLSRTLETAKRQILYGEFPEWLSSPVLAVEARILASQIREDLKTDPDDINDVTLALKDIRVKKKKAILEALKISRRLALWKAAHDNAIWAEIDRLRRLLSKKRKTLSLVEIREQVNYNAILKIFPCWVMGIEDVARVFPLKPALFDYVIVDEASQCSQATALHLAYRARKMVVVGDEKQLQNPLARFLPDNTVRLLLSKHQLDGHTNADVFNAKTSLLGLATRCANSREFLDEHFRSEPAIISWSNKHFYQNRLKILTPIWPRRFEPCMEVHLVPNADDDPDDSQTNVVEAKATIQRLKQIVTNPEFEGLTVGVISPFRKQADLLQDLIYSEFADCPEVIKKRSLIASTADGFQGDERDVILYSMRYGPSSRPGVIHAIEREMERLNVAFTRGRRLTICFVSVPPDDFPKPLSREGSMRSDFPSIRSFLEHALREQRVPMGRLGTEAGDNFDSDFERDVCYGLRARQLKVYTQVPCAGFRIDLVVMDDENRRLAVECDGDFHYDDGDLRPEDYHRQDIIERAGWVVYRVSFRHFYENPQKALDKICDAVKSLETESETLVKDLVQEIETKSEDAVSHLRSEETVQLTLDKVAESEKREIIITAMSEPREKRIPMPKSDVLGTGPINISRNWFALSSRETTLEKPFVLKSFDRGFAYNIGKYLKNRWQLTPRQINYAWTVWQQAIDQGFHPPYEADD